MVPEKVVAVRGRRKRLCRTPHESPRSQVARDVCQSCLNAGYAAIDRKECSDEDLVAKGYWAAKQYGISDYIDDLLKQA